MASVFLSYLFLLVLQDNDRNISPVETFDLIPGQLTVEVYAHSIPSKAGPIQCWSYVTKGLADYGQKELVAPIRVTDQVETPSQYKTLLSFFKTVHAYAAKGTLVDVGASTLLAKPTSLLGAPGLRAVFYTPEQRFEGVNYPEHFLNALVIHAEEQALANDQGALRLMTMLGREALYYPTIPWSDPQRKSIITEEQAKTSILSNLPLMFDWKSTVTFYDAKTDPEKGDRIVIALSDLARENLPAYLVEQQEKDSVLALVCGPLFSADAAFTWVPGKTQPQSIGPPNSRNHKAAGNYIAILADTQTRAAIKEDGFLLFLGPDDLTKFINAISDGTELLLPSSSGLSIELKNIQSKYKDPITGKTYVSKDGWAEYKPDPKASGKSQKKEHKALEMESLVFLTPMEDIKMDGDAIVAYVMAIWDAAAELIPQDSSGDWQPLVVESSIAVDQTASYALSNEQGVLRDLKDKLHALKVPAVPQAIKFQIHYRVKLQE